MVCKLIESHAGTLHHNIFFKNIKRMWRVILIMRPYMTRTRPTNPKLKVFIAMPAIRINIRYVDFIPLNT